MIDLHCHVLPGLDDGARDMDDALAMARQAEADGIEVICATPHIRHDHDVRIHELDTRIAELQSAIDTAGIAVRIARGGEVAEPIVGSLSTGELATVAIGGRWVLLEPAAGPLSQPLLDAVAALAAQGFGAIIAHPERHPGPDLEAVLGEAVESGAVVQATAAALADGGDGAAWLTRLARDGLIHVIGSDAHTTHWGRPAVLSTAYAQLENADRMRATAELVLAGEAPRF